MDWEQPVNFGWQADCSQSPFFFREIVEISGAPNDSFLLNTLKTLLRRSRALLELQNGILSGAIKFVSVRSSQGNLSQINLTFQESKNFSNSSLHRIFESENFRFPFSAKNSLTQGAKCEKLNFRKSQGIYHASFENMTGTVIQKFLAVLKLQKIVSNIYFSAQIFYRKQSLGAPQIQHV